MNRELVEGATYPDRIAALIAEKGEAWELYDRTYGGAEAAAAMLARLNVLDRASPFDDTLRFRDSDERIMTRLGEEGVVLSFDSFDPPPVGPFKKPITRIALPARWSCGIAKDDRAAIEWDETGLIVSVAGRRFRYSREGLTKLVS